VTTAEPPSVLPVAPTTPTAAGTETLPPLPGLEEALAGAGGTFLEVGAGFGVRLRSLLDGGMLPRFQRIVVIDLDPEWLERARALVPEAQAIVGDAEHLPLAAGTVDFAFSDQVIEHVPSDAAMAAEIARVLREGGRAYVGSVLKRRWAWYFYRCNGKWRLCPTHVREYTSLREYTGVFTAAGLRVEATHTLPFDIPLGEALLRMMVRLRLVGGLSFYEAHARSRILRLLSKLRIPIPGYFGVWATLRK